MRDTDTFAIIGGDLRQIAMAESILSDGHNVYTFGFENIKLKNEIVKLNLKDAIKIGNYIILPVPTTKSDSCLLNAPYSSSQIKIDDSFAKLLRGKKVFCAASEKLIAITPDFSDLNLYDYTKREDFAINNAVPTAEGAIQLAMSEFDGTINGSRCLVAGFGRIGKILSRMLKGLGAKVTASARKTKDIAWINLLGYSSVFTGDLGYDSNFNMDFDIIFNTIPNLIFTPDILSKIPKNTILIDLASSPGGVDFDAAKNLKIKAIQALALPGKVAPKSAGEIIKNTIYNMIEEAHL